MTNVAYGIAMPTMRGILTPQRRLLDGISGVSAAWSFNRALRGGAGSWLRVRDTATGTGYDCKDPASVAAALAGDNGTLPEIYDQSGNGHAFVQSTVIQQPGYIAAVSSNGLAAASFDNTDDNMHTAANMDTMFSTSSWYFAGAFQFNALIGTTEGGDAYADTNILFNQATGYPQLAALANGKAIIGIHGSGYATTGAGGIANNTPAVIECRRDAASGKIGVRVNGGTWGEVAASLRQPRAAAHSRLVRLWLRRQDERLFL